MSSDATFDEKQQPPPSVLSSLPEQSRGELNFPVIQGHAQVGNQQRPFGPGFGMFSSPPGAGRHSPLAPIASGGHSPLGPLSSSLPPFAENVKGSPRLQTGSHQMLGGLPMFSGPPLVNGAPPPALSPRKNASQPPPLPPPPPPPPAAAKKKIVLQRNFDFELPDGVEDQMLNSDDDFDAIVPCKPPPKFQPSSPDTHSLPVEDDDVAVNVDDEEDDDIFSGAFHGDTIPSCIKEMQEEKAKASSLPPELEAAQKAPAVGTLFLNGSLSSASMLSSRRGVMPGAVAPSVSLQRRVSMMSVKSAPLVVSLARPKWFPWYTDPDTESRYSAHHFHKKNSSVPAIIILTLFLVVYGFTQGEVYKAEAVWLIPALLVVFGVGSYVASDLTFVIVRMRRQWETVKHMCKMNAAHTFGSNQEDLCEQSFLLLVEPPFESALAKHAERLQLLFLAIILPLYCVVVQYGIVTHCFNSIEDCVESISALVLFFPLVVMLSLLPIRFLWIVAATLYYFAWSYLTQFVLIDLLLPTNLAKARNEGMGPHQLSNSGPIIAQTESLIVVLFFVFPALALRFYTELNARQFFEKIILLQRMSDEIAQQRLKAQAALKSQMPSETLERLLNGATAIDFVSSSSIGVANVVGFSTFCAGKSSEEIIRLLHSLYTSLDNEARHIGVQKVRTFGDAYWVICGMQSVEEEIHCCKVCTFANSVLRLTNNCDMFGKLEARVGVHVGPIVAGIVGVQSMSYDLFGATSQVANEIQFMARPSSILLSEMALSELGQQLGSQPPVGDDVEVVALKCLPGRKVRCFVLNADDDELAPLIDMLEGGNEVNNMDIVMDQLLSPMDDGGDDVSEPTMTDTISLSTQHRAAGELGTRAVRAGDGVSHRILLSLERLVRFDSNIVVKLLKDFYSQSVGVHRLMYRMVTFGVLTGALVALLTENKEQPLAATILIFFAFVIGMLGVGFSLVFTMPEVVQCIVVACSHLLFFISLFLFNPAIVSRSAAYYLLPAVGFWPGGAYLQKPWISALIATSFIILPGLIFIIAKDKEPWLEVVVIGVIPTFAAAMVQNKAEIELRRDAEAAMATSANTLDRKRTILSGLLSMFVPQRGRESILSRFGLSSDFSAQETIATMLSNRDREKLEVDEPQLALEDIGKQACPEHYDFVVVAALQFSGIYTSEMIAQPPQLVAQVNSQLMYIDELLRQTGCIEKVGFFGDTVLMAGPFRNPISPNLPFAEEEQRVVAIGEWMRLSLVLLSYSVNSQSVNIRSVAHVGPATTGLPGMGCLRFDIFGPTVGTTFRLLEKAKHDCASVTQEVVEYWVAARSDAAMPEHMVAVMVAKSFASESIGLRMRPLWEIADLSQSLGSTGSGGYDLTLNSVHFSPPEKKIVNGKEMMLHVVYAE